jgi:hypothetical protein
LRIVPTKKTNELPREKGYYGEFEEPTFLKCYIQMLKSYAKII